MCARAVCAQTDIGTDRLRRLFARLDSHGFIVRHEVRSMLYTYEAEHNMLPPSTSVTTKGPDRKTVERLITRMVQSGKAKKMQISIPGSYQSGEARMVRLALLTLLRCAACTARRGCMSLGRRVT